MSDSPEHPRSPEHLDWYADDRVVRFVCEELGVPVPDEFSVDGEKGPDMVLNLATPPE